ncbi:hypothetical protein V1478_010736 [Vespula squamosa]|uniref:Uncharacterized protein n=1 Tax=Vespula squamosa TaxID=30214 RepID=A0ABD2AF79_VESSQ
MLINVIFLFITTYRESIRGWIDKMYESGRIIIGAAYKNIKGQEKKKISCERYSENNKLDSSFYRLFDALLHTNLIWLYSIIDLTYSPHLQHFSVT